MGMGFLTGGMIEINHQQKEGLCLTNERDRMIAVLLFKRYIYNH